MKSAIFYGLAANPCTIAHVEIIKKLVETYPDRDIVIDVPRSHPWGKMLLDWESRIDMLILVIEAEGLYVDVNNDPSESHSAVRILRLDTDMKTTFERIKYCQTMGFITTVNRDIMVVIGSDHIPVFDEWQFHDELLKSHNFLIIDRGQLTEYAEHKFNDLFYNPANGCSVEWLTLTPAMLSVSSTKIRDAVDTIKAMLPKEVWNRTDLLKLFGIS